VQLLTPYTIGNGRLKVLNLGRFALTLYEKYGVKGIRVCIDRDKLGKWLVIKDRFFKLRANK